MKKVICLAIALTCALAMAGCNAAPAPGSTGKSKPATMTLMDKGLELISEADKLAECQELTALYSTSEEIADIINGIAENDYTAPNAVFVIENTDEMLFNSTLLETKLPDNIKEMVRGKFASAFPAQINAMSGAMTLAATSIVTHGDSFIYEGLKSSTLYLYTYDNGYGFMVTYTPNDENIVNATATAVIHTELAKCSTKEDVVDFFHSMLNLKNISVSVATEEK